MRREPDPSQPDRCPSIDPHGTLQCGRSLHDDDQCQLGGIAWKKDSPPEMSDRERADRLEAMCDRLAGRLSDERRRAAEVLIAAADAWRHEGRAVMFNRDGDDLTPQQRVAKWLRDRAAATDDTLGGDK